MTVREEHDQPVIRESTQHLGGAGSDVGNEARHLELPGHGLAGCSSSAQQYLDAGKMRGECSGDASDAFFSAVEDPGARWHGEHEEC